MLANRDCVGVAWTPLHIRIQSQRDHAMRTTSPLMTACRRRVVLVAAISIVLTTGIVTVIGKYVVLQHETGSLELVEAIVCPTVSPIMGESVKAELELRNRSREQITVCRARTSCGCTRVYPTARPQHFRNVVIPPHSTMYWTAVIDTSSRSGGHQFFVWFDYLDAGVQHTIRGTVRVSIRPGFSASPPLVNVSPADVGARKTVNTELAICDSGTEDDLSISRITVSDPKVVKWSINESLGDSEVQRVHSIRVRYRATLTITPERTGGAPESHWIRFVPNRDATLLHVPIEIRHAPPPFRAIPDALTVGELGDVDVIVRRISIVSRQRPLGRLTIQGGEGVQWTSLPTNDARSKQIVIRINRPWKKTYDIRIRNDDKTILLVPLRIISSQIDE